MKDTTLVSDMFPKGVVLRMGQENGKFTVSWRYREKPYKVTRATIEEAVGEALKAITALDWQGGPL